MFAEFIEKPISGRWPEKHFGETTDYATWVKFTGDNFVEWVGSFNPFGGTLSALLVFEDAGKVFVITSGTGYLIDVNIRMQITSHVIRGIHTAVKDERRQGIIFSNDSCIRRLDIQGNISILSDKYIFDEIEFLEIKDGVLSALYWYYQASKAPFQLQLNLLTGEIIDSFYKDNASNSLK
jgi:hypothetical protein